MSRTRPRPPATLLALVLVLLSPVAAWLAWVSWSDGKPSDAAHVAWFATVALGSVVAGALTPDRWHRRALAPVAVVSTLVTLWWWWSGEDDNSLFVIGVILATPVVAAASLPLLHLGHRLGDLARRRRALRAQPRPRSPA